MYSLNLAWGDLSVVLSPLSVYIKSFQGHWLPTSHPNSSARQRFFSVTPRVFSVLHWKMVTREELCYLRTRASEGGECATRIWTLISLQRGLPNLDVCLQVWATEWAQMAGGHLGSWSVMVGGSSAEPSFAKAVHVSLGIGGGSGCTSWQYAAAWLPPSPLRWEIKSTEGKSWASIAQLVECSPSMTCVDVYATLELRRWRQQGQKVKLILLSRLEGCMTI